MFEHKALAVLLLAACLASTITARVTPSEQDDLTVEQRGLLQNIISRVESFSFELFQKFRKNQLERTLWCHQLPSGLFFCLLLRAHLVVDCKSYKQLYVLEDVTEITDLHSPPRNSVKSADVNVSGMQAIFTDTESPLGHEFSTAMTSFYDANLVPVNFSNSNNAAARINEIVRRATDNFPDNVISADDLKDIELVILSALYFKANWQEPFLKSATFLAPFYNEWGVKVGDVQMMKRDIILRAAYIDALKGSVVKMKYGRDDRFSMLLILPDYGVTVGTIVNNIRTIRSAQILDQLKNNKMLISLQMPKFTVSSSFTVNDILREMGFNELFQEGSLKNISSRAKISKVFHDTKISVSEEGSAAAAVATKIAMFLSLTPEYIFNRPFVYLIMDTTTKFPLFCGQVMHPKYEE